jgi:hypothetical protein
VGSGQCTVANEGCDSGTCGTCPGYAVGGDCYTGVYNHMCDKHTIQLYSCMNEIFIYNYDCADSNVHMYDIRPLVNILFRIACN